MFIFYLKINKVKFDTKIKSIKELKDGIILFHLIKAIVDNFKEEVATEFKNFVPEDSGMRFHVIAMFMKDFLLIEGDLNVIQAQEGDEIELSIFTLIIFSFGAGKETKEVVEAVEALGKADYDLFQEFYVVVEKNKLSFPPIKIEMYEQFLFMKSDSNRKSMLKGDSERNQSSKLGESFQGESPVRKLSSNEYSLDSPMAKACLNSPRDKNYLSRRKIEETYFNEKKRLEKEISNKENLIYELNAELSDQRSEMDEIKRRMEETERKQVEFNK